jgi:hypothetical protein
VDIDLIKGAGKDAAGIRYLAKESWVHGIITTKSHLINSARKEGLNLLPPYQGPILKRLTNPPGTSKNEAMCGTVRRPYPKRGVDLSAIAENF